MIKPRLLHAFLLLTLMACGGGGTGAPAADGGSDAGRRRDGGIWQPPDTGSPRDGGRPPQPAADGGWDAGRRQDGGATHDAGTNHDAGEPDAGPALPAWTVLVYMAADNNLEKYAIDDLNEMLAAKISDDVQLVVQIDRASGFYELGVGGLASWTP